jgi:hypothetical protein
MKIKLPHTSYAYPLCCSQLPVVAWTLSPPVTVLPSMALVKITTGQGGKLA